MRISLGRRQGRFRVPARVVAIPFIVVGSFVAIVPGRQYLDQLGTESWPRVAGQIESASAYHHAGGRRRGSRHGVRVNYTYSVDGRNFTGNRYYLHSNNVGGSESADRVAAELKPGSPAWVFYDPQDPSRCCLATGASGAGWIPSAMGAATVVAGVVLLVFGPRLDAKWNRR